MFYSIPQCIILEFPDMLRQSHDNISSLNECAGKNWKYPLTYRIVVVEVARIAESQY